MPEPIEVRKVPLRHVSDASGLAELIADDRLHPSLAASLNGERFISDPRTPLADDDRVLILSADAGG